MVFFRIVVTDIPSRCLSVHNFENKNASQLFHSFFRIASPRLPADLLATYSLSITICRIFPCQFLFTMKLIEMEFGIIGF